MKKKIDVAAWYTGLGIFAAVINIAVQSAMIFLYKGRYAIELSIVIGTGMGALLRYVLTKRHVFDFQANNIRHDSRLFVLYSTLGVFTTALFWAIEYGFYWIFKTDEMRYMGAVIGLSVGYVIKYQLDKNFVFVDKAA